MTLLTGFQTPRRSPERTQQQLDPAAALGGRVPALALCALSLCWAFAVVLLFQTDRDDVTLKILTLALLIGAATVISVATTPALAPFRTREHLTVHLLTLSAFLVNLIASWGMPRTPQDAWISGSLGLFLIAISAYRPARELVLFGTASVAIIGFFTFLSTNAAYLAMANAANAANAAGTRPLAMVLFAVLPALACCYGAARYSSGIVRDFVRWRDELDRAIADEADTVTNEIYRAVQQERVGDIARDVVPLLDDILYQENITEHHRAQARAIATRIRGGLVEDVDRTWLQTTTAPLENPSGRRVHLDDPDSLASQMQWAQRTALHAFIFSLMDDPSTRDVSVTIYGQPNIAGQVDVATATVAAGLSSRGRTRQARYNPFLAVMRTTFANLDASFTDRDLIVKFDYDRR
jgi:hypothetical protein